MRRFVLCLLLPLGLFGGCARPPVPDLPPPMDAARLVAQVVAQHGAYGNLKGLAKVSVTRSDKSTSLTQAVFLEKPKKLRAEVLSPFGQTLAVVATDGERIDLDARREGTFFRGPATHENLQRFVRVPLQLTDLVRLILADIPLLEQATTRAAWRDDHWVLTLAAGSRRQEIYFDRSLRILRVFYLDDDVEHLVVQYGRFSPETGFPMRVELSMPQLEARAEVDFSSVEVNVALSAGLFRLEAPPGQVVTPLPELRE